MTDPRWTLDNFRRAGRGHLHGASRILENVPARGAPEPAHTPASAAYLAHVALECAMKAQLLSRGGYASAEALAEKDPRAHRAFFQTKEGHNIKKLADQLRLKNFVGTCGKSWSDDACWMRMASADRPYSLRYGAEQITSRAAKEEVCRVSALLGSLLDTIKSVPLSGKRRRTR